MIAANHWFYTIHPLPRALFGLAMLSMATASDAVVVPLLLMIAIALFIAAVEGRWIRVVRSMKLLRWFVVPILILHLCFSPGRLLLPGYPLPFTYEGLMLGSYLSLHLAAIFLAAVALFLCLRRNEWIRALLWLPLMRRELLIYLMLMLPLQRSVSALLHQLRQQWRMRRRWRELPELLVAAFRAALVTADEQANQLWLRWPTSPLLLDHEGADVVDATLILNLICGAVGVLGVVVAWQI